MSLSSLYSLYSLRKDHIENFTSYSPSVAARLLIATDTSTATLLSNGSIYTFHYSGFSTIMSRYYEWIVYGISCKLMYLYVYIETSAEKGCLFTCDEWWESDILQGALLFLELKTLEYLLQVCSCMSTVHLFLSAYLFNLNILCCTRSATKNTGTSDTCK
jgi:hypothetical protein